MFKGMKEAQSRWDNLMPEEDGYPDSDEGWEPEPTFNPEQESAVEEILSFLEGGTAGQFFLLSGAAGTGKTFCIKHLVEQTRKRIVFTAPTNKATKVLRATLRTDKFKPECCTIYSLLGLKMDLSKAQKELMDGDEKASLKTTKVVVIDEVSMVGRELWDKIKQAAKKYGLKVICMGDRNQLPPINRPGKGVLESASPAWSEISLKAELLQVMRFDNQILTLASLIKSKIGHPAPSIKLANDNDEIEGVWYLQQGPFMQAVVKAARSGDFSNKHLAVKAIAWRNKTVGKLNQLIRANIFDNAGEQRWLVGDRIILTAPARDASDKPIGCTDDEGIVERVEVCPHPSVDGYQCWNLSVVTDENKRISLYLLHESSNADYQLQLNFLSQSAKLESRKWKAFWEFKDQFHQAQHGYAITAHRAQGSTYDSAYVVWNDILLNRNRGEAFRCLYVACTRPKRKLILGGM